jgi:hypothetical protein
MTPPPYDFWVLAKIMSQQPTTAADYAGEDPPARREQAAEIRRSLPRPARHLSWPCHRQARPPADRRGRGAARPLAWSGPRGPGRRFGSRTGIEPARGVDLHGDAARPYLVFGPRRRRR